MTVDDIIARMEAGERLRWVQKSEVDRLRDGDVDSRELWIGNRAVSNDLILAVLNHPRIKELSGNETNQNPYIDYELVEQ